MPKIDIIDFMGEMPKVAERKLPLSAAVNAENVRLASGNLESWRGMSDVETTLRSGHVKSLFYYESSHWFNWLNNVNAIKSPIAQDSYARVYFTGEGVPKVTSNLIATGGDPKPFTAYDLGVPAPDEVITIASITPDPDPEVDLGDTSDDETRFYVMTHVTEYGEEGPPGAPSSAVELQSPKGDIVTLTLPIPAFNTQNITHKRIYRTATSGSATDYYYVGEVSVATTAFVDNVSGAGLGASLATETYEPPPSNMQGLVMGPNGIAAGFAGNEFVPSEAYLPYAYPFEYRRSVEHDIVSIAATATGFVLGTKGNPYVFTGVSPDALSEMRLDVMQACVSARSMIDMGEFALYASPDGLVAAGEGGAELITEQIISRREWAEFYPETIHAYRYEGQYFAFYGDTEDNGSGIGGFVFNPKNGSLSRLNFYATAGYSDLETDTLYLVVDDSGNKLKAWDSAESLLPYAWKSKVFRGKAVSFSCAKVYTDKSFDSEFRLWADGQLVMAVAGSRKEAFRLPSVRAEDWQVEVSGKAAVQRITLATSFSEID